MIDIKIKEKTYNLPENWDEITLRQFIDFHTIEKQEDNYTILKRINCITNIPISDIRRMSSTDIDKLYYTIKFIEELPTNEVDKLVTIDFEGREWIVVKDINREEFGLYIDFDNYQKQLGEYNSLPFIMAMILRKNAKEQYSDYDLEERAKLMEQLPVDKMIILSSFFLTRLNKLTNNILDLELEILDGNQKISHLKLLEKNMDGSQQLCRWQKKMLRKSIQFLELKWKQFLQHSNISQISEKPIWNLKE